MGKSEGDSQGWLVTYSDLVTLILTFFVLLYTMTSGVEKTSFNSFIQYFQKNAGFLPESQAAVESIENKIEPEQLEQMMEEQMERWEAFADFLHEQDVASEVDIQLLRDGVKITLSDSLTFESGSSELLPEAKIVLQQVAEVLGEREIDIEVQGHTDNVPISNILFQSNWHLGAARSVSVVQYLQAQADMAPSHFKASSFGEYRPVSENETADGRRRNRRVEIYLKDLIARGALEAVLPFDEPIPVYNPTTN
ncbi:OmpA/MotB family protein [Gracilimonas sp.]|uniref:OmpA/MotB family protein n=1 Tax=Gracilimonas sp. TaxID=1974203 RepID=UPI003D0F11D5